MNITMLYGHHESGHSFKVALALALLRVEHEFRWVDLRLPPEMRPPDVRAVCKFGEVPVFIDNGNAMVQSNAILLHLARKCRRLGGESDELYALAREWLFWEANRVGFSLANLRHLVRFEPHPDPTIVAWLRERLVPDLTRLNAEFAARPFLLGDNVSVADLSCFGYLFLAPEAHLDLTPWPFLQLWLSRIQELPGWRSPAELMPRPPEV